MSDIYRGLGLELDGALTWATVQASMKAGLYAIRFPHLLYFQTCSLEPYFKCFLIGSIPASCVAMVLKGCVYFYHLKTASQALLWCVNTFRTGVLPGKIK